MLDPGVRGPADRIHDRHERRRRRLLHGRKVLFELLQGHHEPPSRLPLQGQPTRRHETPRPVTLLATRIQRTSFSPRPPKSREAGMSNVERKNEQVLFDFTLCGASRVF